MTIHLRRHGDGRAGYVVTYCTEVVSNFFVTTDPAEVTCQRCRNTRHFRGLGK